VTQAQVIPVEGVPRRELIVESQNVTVSVERDSVVGVHRQVHERLIAEELRRTA
jgi:hypothetical protein